MNISIYGIGNFGYAFLKHLDNKNDGAYTLTAYDHKFDRVEYLNNNRSHPIFHPTVKLSSDVNFTSNIETLLRDADIILLAIPSIATHQALANIRMYAKESVIILNTAKSLDIDTGKRLSEIVSSDLEGFRHSYALLAGGTIAKDLFAHEPLGADIVGTDQNALDILKNVFESSNLSIYTTTDIVGVEYAAACKNILSILAGIVKGLGFSYGSETHIISKNAGLIVDICVTKLGADPKTFSIGSQSWGNDMWMSCTGNTRNREFGILIGEGLPVDEALTNMKSRNRLVEGVNTLEAIIDTEGLKELEITQLLHKLVVEKSIDIDKLKNHILRLE